MAGNISIDEFSIDINNNFKDDDKPFILDKDESSFFTIETDDNGNSQSLLEYEKSKSGDDTTVFNELMKGDSIYCAKVGNDKYPKILFKDGKYNDIAEAANGILPLMKINDDTNEGLKFFYHLYALYLLFIAVDLKTKYDSDDKMKKHFSDCGLNELLNKIKEKYDGKNTNDYNKLIEKLNEYTKKQKPKGTYNLKGNELERATEIYKEGGDIDNLDNDKFKTYMNTFLNDLEDIDTTDKYDGIKTEVEKTATFDLKGWLATNMPKVFSRILCNADTIRLDTNVDKKDIYVIQSNKKINIFSSGDDKSFKNYKIEKTFGEKIIYYSVYNKDKYKFIERKVISTNNIEGTIDHLLFVENENIKSVQKLLVVCNINTNDKGELITIFNENAAAGNNNKETASIIENYKPENIRFLVNIHSTSDDDINDDETIKIAYKSILDNTKKEIEVKLKLSNDKKLEKDDDFELSLCGKKNDNKIEHKPKALKGKVKIGNTDNKNYAYGLSNINPTNPNEYNAIDNVESVLALQNLSLLPKNNDDKEKQYLFGITEFMPIHLAIKENL